MTALFFMRLSARTLAHVHEAAAMNLIAIPMFFKKMVRRLPESLARGGVLEPRRLAAVRHNRCAASLSG